VGDDETPAIEQVVADQVVNKGCDLFTELLGLSVELREGFGKAVGDLDVLATEGAEELDVVVAGDAECFALGDEFHHEAEDGGSLEATVDEVADEDELAGRTGEVALALGGVGLLRKGVAELGRSSMSSS
jgi:hypothetical protein